MQLASPQPKTPVANGQPRSVALYRILHLIIISLPRPVRRGMFGLVVSIASIAMQCSAGQSRLVPSAMSQKAGGLQLAHEWGLVAQPGQTFTARSRLGPGPVVSHGCAPHLRLV